MQVRRVSATGFLRKGSCRPGPAAVPTSEHQKGVRERARIALRARRPCRASTTKSQSTAHTHSTLVCVRRLAGAIG
eukprot:2087012-Alexandrium_andersonii.AAC.1